ncbi:cytochrome P450 [Mycena epipterygia]|nr:cytochrome P450 [Mycena epipterygia]
MGSGLNSSAEAIFCGLVFIAISIIYFKRRSTLPLPPGPKKLPLVGNLFSMPSSSEWETYWKWSQEYGSDIIHVNAAGTSIIILSSFEAAEDLLEKRSVIYSDRPRLTMLNELVGGDFMFAFAKYGDTWRTHRRLFHHEFQPTAVKRFHQQELQEAHNLIRRMLETPDDFAQHFQHVISATVISIAYGLDVQPSNDPYVNAARAALRAMSLAAVPGKFLVDIIPPLKFVPSWFPGGGFRRKAAEWNQLVKNMVDLPFMDAKRTVKEGVARASFITERLRALDENEADAAKEHDIKQVAGTIYATGTDTLMATLLMFLRAMLESPEAQKKAQKEIDSVVRPGHLPDFADQNSTPYVTAVIKETMRWWTVAPIGVPHFLAVEDIYRGYRIPRGSVVIANAWAMLHDESVYPDPHSFKPERFLKDGQLNPAVRDPDVFGFGRRACPGRHMASDTLWIMVASMLSVFDITKAVDKDGSPIDPPPGHVSELVVTPSKFKCAIRPRSREAVELICSTNPLHQS